MSADPFPAAVARALGDDGTCPAVEPRGMPPRRRPIEEPRTVTRSGAVPSPRGGVPPAAGRSSGRGCAPTAKGEATVLPSTAAPTGALAQAIHRLARAFWRAVSTRTFPDLAGVAETTRHQAALRKMRGA